MYADKTLKCKECGAEFVFTAGEQEFYAERASSMNPRDARHAAMPARTHPDLTARCLLLPVPPAARRPESPSSHVRTVRFIAANVLQR